MTGYLKTLVALVVALMATVGGSQDAEAVNGTGLNAQPESVGSLFHLAADRVQQAKWDKCQKEAMRSLLRIVSTDSSYARQNAIRWSLDERIRWVFDDVHPNKDSVMNAYWGLMRDDNPERAIREMCRIRDNARLVLMNANWEKTTRRYEKNVEEALEYMESRISEIRSEISKAQ